MTQSRNTAKIGAAIVSLAIAATAAAQSPALSIEDPWMRALPNHLPAAGYFRIENRGNTPAVLAGATSPACGHLMLHRTVTEGGTGRMEMVDRVEVPAGGAVSFAPGGYHLMCTMPSAAVKPGHTIAVTLTFSGGISVEVQFPVRTATGK